MSAHAAESGLPVPVRPSIRGIAQDVARRRTDVTVDEIFSVSRLKRVTSARQEVMWEGRRAGWTFPMIGRRFPSLRVAGFVDHTTVIHGVRQHAKRRREAILARVAAENARSARKNWRPPSMPAPDDGGPQTPFDYDEAGRVQLVAA